MVFSLLRFLHRILKAVSPLTEFVPNMTGFDFFVNHMGLAQPGLLVYFLKVFGAITVIGGRTECGR